MNNETATADMPMHNRLRDVVAIALYALGIGAGTLMGLMGLLLAA